MNFRVLSNNGFYEQVFLQMQVYVFVCIYLYTLLYKHTTHNKIIPPSLIELSTFL